MGGVRKNERKKKNAEHAKRSPMGTPEQTKPKTLRDKRRPSPLNVDLARKGNAEGLSTPDIQDVQTPVLQKLLIQNQLSETGRQQQQQQQATVKQENLIEDSNPPSVDSATSSTMSQEAEVTTVVQQDEDNGQQITDQSVMNVASVLLKTSTAPIQNNLQAIAIPTQPIDMDTIEVEKQDRKRQRNRIAATKCRKRKIERITQLEHEVRELNEQLQKRIKQKRELEIEVDEIRNRLKIHIKQGCSGLEEYLQD